MRVRILVVAAWIAVAACDRTGCGDDPTCLEPICVVEPGRDSGDITNDAGTEDGGAHADGAAAEDAAAEDAALPCPARSTRCADDQTLWICADDGGGHQAVSCAEGCNQIAAPARCNGPLNFPAAALCSGSSDTTVTADTVIDTDSGTIGGVAHDAVTFIDQGSGAPQLAVFGFDRLTIADGATVAVVGQRALVLAVCNSVQIDGVLDLGASSTTGHDYYFERGGPGGFNGGAHGEAGLGPGAGQPGSGGFVTSTIWFAAGSGGAGHGGAGGGGSGGGAAGRIYLSTPGGSGLTIVSGALISPSAAPGTCSGACTIGSY